MINKPPQLEELYKRQKNYIEEIIPLINLKIKIYNFSIPTLIISSNGEIERKYNFSEETLSTLQIIDEAINYIKMKHFGYDYEH